MLVRLLHLFDQLLVPRPFALAREMLAAMHQNTVRSPLMVAIAFAFIAQAAPNRHTALIILLMGVIYVALIVGSRKAIQTWLNANTAEPNAAQEQNQMLALKTLLTQGVCLYFLLGCMLASVPWVMNSSRTTEEMVIITLAIIAYASVQGIVLNAIPLMSLVCQLPMTISLAVCWQYSQLTHSNPMTLVVVLMFVISQRGAWRTTQTLTESLKTRIELREALQLQRKQARELESSLEANRLIEREKMRLFSAANHDLRQPISAASLYVGILSGRIAKLPLPLQGALEDPLDKIDNALLALDGIIGSISEITHPDKNEIQVRIQKVSLNCLISGLLKEFGDVTDDKSSPIESEQFTVNLLTDPDLLTRMLRNILDNSFKYAPGARLRISSEHRASNLILVIRDYGPGIPNQELLRVFEEYVQLENPERDRNKGLGLGLSIVKRFATALGLRVWFESPQNGGLRACIDISSIITTEPISNQVRAQPIENLNSGRTKDKHIVIIDDDDGIRHALEVLLTEWGSHVRAFASAEFAMHYLQNPEKSPDLVLLDNRLPDAEGIDTALQIRSIHPNCKLYLITGDTDVSVRERADTHQLDILYKPISVQKILELLELHSHDLGAVKAQPTLM